MSFDSFIENIKDVKGAIPRGYTITKQLGLGREGVVYVLCKNQKGTCQVIKDQEFGNMYLNEVKMAKKFHSAKLGPQIFWSKSYTRGDGKRGLLRMGQARVSLDNLFKLGEALPDAWLQYIFDSVVYILTQMCRHKLTHGDMHVGNIVFDKHLQLRLIDFGWSMSKGCNKGVDLAQLIRSISPLHSPAMHEHNRQFLKTRFMKLYRRITKLKDYQFTTFEDAEREYERLFEGSGGYREMYDASV